MKLKEKHKPRKTSLYALFGWGGELIELYLLSLHKNNDIGQGKI